MKNYKLFDIDQAESPSMEPEAAPVPQNTPKDTCASSDRMQEKPSIYNPIAAQKEAEARYTEVHAAHQDAIRKAGQCRADINKGIQAGEDPVNLLLKAIECISLMTGETLFYSQNREQIKAIYGVGLLEPAPLEMELDEVQQRLIMLTRPELEKEPPESWERIRQAVKRHREREAQLVELLRLNSQ